MDGKNLVKLPFWSFFDYIRLLYFELEPLSDKDFDVAADKSIWPECLKKMRSEGKNIQEIITETSPAKILCVIKKYQSIKGENK